MHSQRVRNRTQKCSHTAVTTEIGRHYTAMLTFDSCIHHRKSLHLLKVCYTHECRISKYGEVSKCTTAIVPPDSLLPHMLPLLTIF